MRNTERYRHVTPTGRAISTGRVTRASHLVRSRCRGQEPPLPVDMQCHPKALHRTPIHPNCGLLYTRAHGVANQITRDIPNAASYIRGKGLRRAVMRYALEIDGKVRGYTDEVVSGLAYAKAAQAAGLAATCIDLRGV